MPSREFLAWTTITSSPRLLLGQLLCRQLAQFVIDQRQQLSRGVGIAFFDGGQDAGHLAHGAEDNPQTGGPQAGRGSASSSGAWSRPSEKSSGVCPRRGT